MLREQHLTPKRVLSLLPIFFVLALIGVYRSSPHSASGIALAFVNVLPASPVAIAAGESNSCALTSTGQIVCWGENQSGQLSSDTDTNYNTPLLIPYLANVASIAPGSHICVVTAAGGVKCWGENGWGQLGNGSNVDSKVPVDVQGLSSGVTAVSTGSGSTCALTTAGGVKCWGGTLGNGTWTSSSVPVDVQGLSSGVAGVDVGPYHTCVVMTSGGVKCWGENYQYQLGDGTSTDSNVPVDSQLGFSGMVQIRHLASLQLNEEFLHSGHMRTVGSGVEPRQSG